MLFQLVALPMKGVASALLERSFSRPLLHLGFRLLRYQNYRARRLNVDLRFLFDVRVREIEEEFRSHGFDDLHDELIHLFFLKFVAPEYLLPEVAGEFEEQTDLSEMLIDDLAKRYVDLKDDVDALEKKYKEDEVLNFVRGTRYAAMFFVNTMYLDTKSGKYYESLAKLHGGFTSRPDLPQIEKLKRKAARLARISAEAIRDREAYQIQIDHNDVVVFLAVATPVFFISGYVYNLIFLGYFGIDVSLYFGLSDYISSSVDQIRFSIVGAIASIVGLLSARIEASRKSYSQIRNEREKREHSVIKNKGLYFFFVLAAVVSANSLFVPESPNVLPLAAVATVCFIVWTARFFARLFGNSDRTLFYLVFASAYTFYLAAGITNDLFKVTKSESGLYEVSLNWKDGAAKAIRESLLLGSNDNYLFLWNKDDDVAYVVERSAISHVQVRD